MGLFFRELEIETHYHTSGKVLKVLEMKNCVFFRKWSYFEDHPSGPTSRKFHIGDFELKL